MRGRQSCRPGTDHGHLLRVHNARLSAIRSTGLRDSGPCRSVTNASARGWRWANRDFRGGRLSHRDGRTPGRRSRRMDSGPGVTVRFLIPTLRDQGHIAPGLRVNRTGLHAREVRLQPVQVNEFCARGSPTACQRDACASATSLDRQDRPSPSRRNIHGLAWSACLLRSRSSTIV